MDNQLDMTTFSAKKMTHYDLVGEFHETFGHPMRTTKYTDISTQDHKLLQFRHDLIKEELDEFFDAYRNNDLVEMADALCDLSYVIHGAMHCFGIYSDQSHDDNDNMDGKNLKDIVMDYIGTSFEMAMYTSLNNMLLLGDFIVIEYELGQMLKRLYRLGYCLGFPMDRLFREVHRSNMTKVCGNIEQASRSIEYYIKNGRYPNPKFRKKGEYYVVYCADTSKILKNIEWQMPRIKELLI